MVKHRESRPRSSAAPGRAPGKTPGKANDRRIDAGFNPGKLPAKPSRDEKHAGRRGERATEPRETVAAANLPERPLIARSGDRPSERVPVILESLGAGDFHLIDTGNGLKLEQYGPYRIVRPEAQALWQPTVPAHLWDNADAIFTGDTEEDGMGRWRFPRQVLGETWPLQLLGVDFLGRFTSFRHVGVFPEQIVHWDWMKQQIEAAKRPLKVLNLFGYTGLASLVAARAGAEVTHVDASKKAIGWARENQEMAGLGSKPIRWIVDDAVKFAEREERRGSRYDIILFDPPAYGRGPKGEVWQLFEDLPALTDLCRAILTPKPLAVVLTAYSIRASFFAIHALMRDTFAGMGGKIESGELIIREKSAGRALSTSLFSRWVA